MKTARGIPGPLAGTVTILLAGVALGSCGDDGTGPAPSDLPDPGQTPVLVSEPVSGEAAAPVRAEATQGAAATSGGAVTSSAAPSAYVSYAPGSIPGADSAFVTNISTGYSTGARMVDGGLDPIAVPAAVGDTLVLEIFSASALVARDRVTVPRRDPPKILRTSPRRGKTRVPLNAHITIVFSEPVSRATVNSGSIVLLNGTQAAPVDILIDENGLIVELVPTEPLQAGATHMVLVTTEVEDRAGDPVEAQYLGDFTTEFDPGTGALTVTTATQNNLDPDGLVLIMDGTPVRVLDAEGTVTLGSVPAGDHELEITDVAPNCGMEGENPRTVSVVESATLAVDFTLACTDPPDGRILFYRSGASASWISVMNADGSGTIDLRPVEAIDDASRLSSSPDGHRIAFSEVNEDGGHEIYLMDRAGGEVRPLRPGGNADRWERSPSWGPDGDRIMLETSAGLWRADTLGGYMEQVISGQYLPHMPSWSPEGERLVWASAYFGHLMYKRDLQRPLSIIREGDTVCGGGPCRDDLPLWSPDGTRILFRRIGVPPEYPGGLWVWHYESGGEELLAEGATWFDWSPDGSRIVYTDAEGIVVINADGSGMIRVRALSEHYDENDERAYSRVSWGR